MPAPKKRKPPVASQTAGTEYRGKQTRTGNSSGFRFEGALFKSHPEFNGEVRAHVIAPGRMLVLAETEAARETTDPVMTSFLAFLAQDIARAPQDIRPLDTKLAKRAAKLTKGIAVSPDEDLGDGVSM
jgi:PrlF antitoxin of toxin-antitoxin system YhaV/PrlF